jgi:hypothetical protein
VADNAVKNKIMRYLRFETVELIEFDKIDMHSYCINFETQSGSVYTKVFQSKESRQKWYEDLTRIDYTKKMIWIDLDTQP